MNKQFKKRIEKLPILFRQLIKSEPFTEKGIKSQKGKAGIYIFFEGGVPVHVGRTRNLAGRLRGHISNSHYSASFAFKQVRRKLGIKPSYQTKTSRPNLLKQLKFQNQFKYQLGRIKKMNVRFLEVPDPLDQYLLELYAHIELDLELDEFDTH